MSIDHDCPTCRAKAGEKCKNYKGQGKAPCPERGLDQAETQARMRKKAARHAAKKNQAEAEAMPLFAGTELLPQMTEADAYNRKRQIEAQRAENPRGLITQGDVHGVDLLAALNNRHIERIAAEVIGTAFADLYHYCRKTYPSADYWRGFWRRVLTGARIEMKWEKIVDRQPGEPATRCTLAYQRQHMTPEQFEERFAAPRTYAPAQQPGDNGLADRLDRIFSEIRNNRA